MLYLSLIAGLVLLIIGGEGLVRGAVNLSHRLGVSKAFIGVAVIGFGTSMPEMVVSVEAALADLPGIAAGNVVGSNIANILLILGLSALVSPQLIATRVLYRDGIFLLFVTFIVSLAISFMTFSRIQGLALIGVFAIFMVYSYFVERAAGHDLESGDPQGLGKPPRLFFNGLLSLIGIAGLAIGADLFVDAATQIALAWGVRPSIIGLSVVALGTSMPELVASLVAAYRKQSELVVGNIIGSNLFNLLLILGTAVTISPLSLANQPIGPDIWIMSFATLALFFCLRTGYKLDRQEGLVFTIAYGFYALYLARSFI